MASLTNTKIKDTYDGLLKTTDNDALGGTYKLITDGLGNSSGVYLGTGGNVGIGENDPDRILHLKSSVPGIRLEDSDVTGLYHEFFASSAGFFQFKADGGNVQSNSGFLFEVDNDEKMRIDSSGVVQVRNQTPTIQLYNTDTSLSNEQTLGDLDWYQSDPSGSGANVVGKIRGVNESNFQGSGALAFHTGISGGSGEFAVVEKMRIDSGGKVGIGTTDPQKLLHIASTSAQSVITLQRTNTNTSGAIGALQWTALDNHTVASMVALGDGNDEGAHITFNTTSAASSDNPFGISERMRIDSSGFVGIGETDPDRQLHLKSSVPAIRLEDSDVSGLYHEFLATAAGEFQFKADGGNVQSNSSFTFTIDGSEKMRISSGGVVTIGNTSQDPIADRVNGFSAGHNGNGRLKLMQTGTDALLVGRGGAGNVTRFYYNATGSASQVGSISITSSSTSYNTSSDYRLKENVVDMTGALDRVEQLQPKRFNFISDAETTVDGFIAHEVQSVIPEAITGEKDAVDDEGNPEYQGIDQSKIVPLLVGAIKELKAEIETLKSQINS